MRITDTLESLLRLLVSTNPIHDERRDKPVADWVARTNAATEPRPVEPSTVDPLERAELYEAEPGEGDEDVSGVPGLLDSLISWVQSDDDEPRTYVFVEPEVEDDPVFLREPEPVSELDPEPEPEQPVEVEPPEPAPAPAAMEESLVPVGHDLTHLEAAAHVAESLSLGYHLGSAVERIAVASTHGSQGIPALREAAWLIERYISIIEKRPLGADLHMTAARLARTGDAIAGLRALAETLDGPEPPLA